jgi:2-(1,2-epoxy-1,2-dihydrophenyl)acetyl-CoA isomerase
MASAVPIVVGVQGWAAGGGLSLALLGDVLVFGRSARVRAAYTAIGLTPDGGMSWTLPRAVGASRARDLILTNRSVSAAEAEAMGLANRVVDDQELRATVDRLAAELADGATDALGAARDLIHGGWFRDFAEQLDEEAKAIAASADSVQGREGVRAFVERRAPRYHRW